MPEIRTQGQPQWAIVGEDRRWPGWRYFDVQLDGVDAGQQVMRVWTMDSGNSFTPISVDYGQYHTQNIDGLEVREFVGTGERSLPQRPGRLQITDGIVARDEDLLAGVRQILQQLPPKAPMQGALARAGVTLAREDDVNALPTLAARERQV